LAIHLVQQVTDLTWTPRFVLARKEGYHVGTEQGSDVDQLVEIGHASSFPGIAFGFADDDLTVHDSNQIDLA
jgi:hypothetical protein